MELSHKCSNSTEDGTHNRYSDFKNSLPNTASQPDTQFSTFSTIWSTRSAFFLFDQFVFFVAVTIHWLSCLIIQFTSLISILRHKLAVHSYLEAFVDFCANTFLSDSLPNWRLVHWLMKLNLDIRLQKRNFRSSFVSLFLLRNKSITLWKSHTLLFQR